VLKPSAAGTQTGTNVAIVGAGLAGALQVCLLAEHGYEITVSERRPETRTKGGSGGRSIKPAFSKRRY
jgi:kynurenine 3-monooxygenase